MKGGRIPAQFGFPVLANLIGVGAGNVPEDGACRIAVSVCIAVSGYGIRRGIVGALMEQKRGTGSVSAFPRGHVEADTAGAVFALSAEGDRAVRAGGYGGHIGHIDHILSCPLQNFPRESAPERKAEQEGIAVVLRAGIGGDGGIAGYAARVDAQGLSDGKAFQEGAVIGNGLQWDSLERRGDGDVAVWHGEAVRAVGQFRTGDCRSAAGHGEIGKHSVFRRYERQQDGISGQGGRGTGGHSSERRGFIVNLYAVAFGESNAVPERAEEVANVICSSVNPTLRIGCLNVIAACTASIGIVEGGTTYENDVRRPVVQDVNDRNKGTTPDCKL